MYLAKRSIINFLKDKLQEKRGFKYSILPIVTIKKWKAEINAWEFQNICIRSDTITVTDQRFYLNDASTKILSLLDTWEVEGSGWVIEQVQDIHININNDDPLAGSSYIPLPRQLQNSIHGLIIIKNTGFECLKWCHVRLLNPTNSHPERIKKLNKKIAEQLDYSGINFPAKEKNYPIFDQRFSINLNIFYYNKRVYPLYISEQHNERVLKVLLLSDEEKSHYVFIKDFNRMMCSQTGTKNHHKKFYCMH